MLGTQMTDADDDTFNADFKSELAKQ